MIPIDTLPADTAGALDAVATGGAPKLAPELAALLEANSGAAPAAGASVGGFTVTEVLSAKGPTLRAKGPDGSDVVLKALPGKDAAARARALAAQVRARKAASKEAAVPIGFVRDGGITWVVRPFVAGVTLAKIMATLAQEEVPPDAPTWRLAAGARGGGANVTGAKIVCRIGQYAAQALVDLHAAGTIHGALKPENLVCDDTLKATVLDAGLGAPQPPFEAPEVITAKDRDAARNASSDLYALGVVLWQSLTRKPIFTGDVEKATLAQKPDSPLKHNFKASEPMSTVILALLEKDPKKRYASALELREDLDRYHTNEPIRRKGGGFLSKLFG